MRTFYAFAGFAFLCFVISFSQFSSAQDLILPAPEMPTYALGSVKESRDAFGRALATIEYQQSKVGVGIAMLAGKTPDGPLKMMGSGFLQDATGKLELSELFSGGNGLNAELYLVITGSFAEECSFKCLASNVVRVGNPIGVPTTAREWNEIESLAYQKDLVGRKPPSSLPAGYQLVRASTKLVPGMPIKVGRFD